MDDLKMAAVAQVTIMDAQNLLNELDRMRHVTAKQIGALSIILKAFSDLYLEMGELQEHRHWLAKQIAKAERQADRLRTPSWFWDLVQDKEAPIPNQLNYRASWLMEHHPKITLDDFWDRLAEVFTYNAIPVDINLLEKLVMEHYHAGSREKQA